MWNISQSILTPLQDPDMFRQKYKGKMRHSQAAVGKLNYIFLAKLSMILLVTCTIPGPSLDTACPFYASNSSLDSSDNVVASHRDIGILTSEHDAE